MWLALASLGLPSTPSYPTSEWRRLGKLRLRPKPQHEQASRRAEEPRYQTDSQPAAAQLPLDQQSHHTLRQSGSVCPQPPLFQAEPLDDAPLSGIPFTGPPSGVVFAGLGLDSAATPPFTDADSHALSEDDPASLTEVADPSEPASPALTVVDSLARTIYGTKKPRL